MLLYEGVCGLCGINLLLLHYMRGYPRLERWRAMHRYRSRARL